jgi:hypothetical protein
VFIKVTGPSGSILDGSQVVRLSNATTQDRDALREVLSLPDWQSVDHPLHSRVNALLRNDLMWYLWDQMYPFETASGRPTEQPQTNTPSTQQGSAAGNQSSNASTNTATKK